MDTKKYMQNLRDYTRITPDCVTTIQSNQIFVFGTDAKGSQRFGAAGTAHRLFGARRGISEGLTGNSYAIATKDESYENVFSEVQRFIEFAQANTHLIFLVTPIGCGHAGFGVELVAPMFADALCLTNVFLPKTFIDFYKASTLAFSSNIKEDENKLNHTNNKIDFIVKALSESKIECEKGFKLTDSTGNIIAEAEIAIESLKIIGTPINSISYRCFKNAGYSVVELDDIIGIINEVKA